MGTLKHILSIILALGFTFLILFTLDEAETKVEKEKLSFEAVANNSLKPVTVFEVSNTSTHGVIQSFGVVKPRWKTFIKSKQTGEILSISNQLQMGEHIKKGGVLFTFDNHHYQTQLAEGRNLIAQAELLLHNEKEQARIVRDDWRIFQKKGNPSAFALRIPQIKAAKAQLSLATVHFKEVKNTASYSKIVAPYNGVVISRSAKIGDLVEVGQTLAEIISTDTLDITLKLNQRQWDMLDSNWQGQKATVFATNGEAGYLQKWTATIERDGGRIDSKTRLRLLHLALNSRQKPLPGSFVSVEIKGKKLTNLLKIPQTSLTSNGLVWYVDNDNKLRRFLANVIFTSGQNIFISLPPLKNKKNYSIVVTPLSFFLPGIEIKPRPIRKEAILNQKDQ